MKFKKRINLFEDFKSEIATGTKTKTNEVPVNTTKSEAGVEVKTELLKDVDAILNNLETLSAQIGEAKEFIYGFVAECHEFITEELASETPNQELIDEVLEAYLEVFEDLEINVQLNEAGEDKVGKKMWNFIYWAPKARKAQQKVNKLKLNKKALDLAADDAPNKEQAASLTAKSLRVKTQMDDLQKIVDDRFKDKGEYVQGVIRRQKQQGQLELIKQETGMSDDPDRKEDLVQQAKEIQKKAKEEEAALKELEPSEKDKEAAAKKLEDEKIAAKKAADAARAEKQKTKTNSDSTEETPAETSTETPAEKPAEKPADSAEETPAKKPNRPESGKNSKDDMIQRYKELLAKTKDPDKKQSIQLKIDKLKNESEEMFMDSNFISLLESELAEFSREIIAESFGFQTSSVADRFRKLM